MIENKYLTDNQRRKIKRNEQIKARFLTMEGAISAIVNRLGNEFGLSSSAIRVVLRKQKCIGWPNGQRYSKKSSSC